jgi:uncharacterized MAPEG superfamily protein
MPGFTDYRHAIASLALWAIWVMILSGLSSRGRTSAARSDCGKPKWDYSDRWYRSERAFMNAVEASGPFIAATLAAILAGAAPFWVNLFASVFITARVAVAIVHIGTVNQPLRSAVWSIGLVCILAEAVLALGAIF